MEAMMGLSKEQVLNLKRGDVLVTPASSSAGKGRYAAVLDRVGNRLVISVAASRIEEIPPVRNYHEKFFVLNESGEVYNSKGGLTAFRKTFEVVIVGAAADVSLRYCSRIQPSKVLANKGMDYYGPANLRSPEVLNVITRINYLVFNNDHEGDILVLSEMFKRAIQGRPEHELPIYISVLFSAYIKNEADMASGLRGNVIGVLKVFRGVPPNIEAEAKVAIDKMMGRKI